MGAADESRVDAAVAHVFHQFAGAAFLQHQAHLRRVLAKAADQRRHEGMEGRRTGETHRQPAAFSQRHAPHAIDRLVDQGQDAARVGQQGAAAFGQLHAARQPVEQRDAQLLFQHADLLAQWGLADAEPGGGLGQVGFLGHRQEIAQQTQVDGCHMNRI